MVYMYGNYDRKCSWSQNSKRFLAGKKYEIENYEKENNIFGDIPVWGNYVIFFALIILVWPRLFWEAF
jgi:hypothetical protein